MKKNHEANGSEIEVDYAMNETDTGITSSHYVTTLLKE